MRALAGYMCSARTLSPIIDWTGLYLMRTTLPAVTYWAETADEFQAQTTVRYVCLQACIGCAYDTGD